MKRSLCLAVRHAVLGRDGILAGKARRQGFQVEELAHVGPVLLCHRDLAQVEQLLGRAAANPGEAMGLLLVRHLVEVVAREVDAVNRAVVLRDGGDDLVGEPLVLKRLAQLFLDGGFLFHDVADVAMPHEDAELAVVDADFRDLAFEEALSEVVGDALIMVGDAVGGRERAAHAVAGEPGDELGAVLFG